MKLSQLRDLIDQTIAEHGDIEVGCQDYETNASDVARFEVAMSSTYGSGWLGTEDAPELGEKFLRVS